MKKIILITAIAFNFHNLVISQSDYYVEYDSSLVLILNDIYDLKLKSAEINLKRYTENNPSNLAHLHVSNYIDFFHIFIKEEKPDFKKREKNKSKRISAIKNNLDDSNPYKAFLIAEIQLQWAISRAKFNQLFKASREVLNAYYLLEDNREEHPDFIYNHKSLSIIHSLVETMTLPGVIKKIFGIEGSIDMSLLEIENVIEYSYNHTFPFSQEADAIKTFILFFQANKKKEAWTFLKNSRIKPEHSLLSTFLVAKIAQRSGKNEKAIEVLQNKPTGSEYEPFLFLDFLMGLSKIRKLDSSCQGEFKKFTNNFLGQHYIKEAHQKLAWASLIFEEDWNSYSKIMNELKKQGATLFDADKQALLESKSMVKPNITILKARLLFDGGQFEEAYNILKSNNEQLSQYHKFEQVYRLGRCASQLNMKQEAKDNFIEVVNYSDYNDSYFKCNAALQLGLIYEEEMNFERANRYFNMCIDLNPKSYKRSLHQKAKTGLKRLNR